jgi:hypothetical protein
MERLKQQFHGEPRSSPGTDHGSLTFVRGPINPFAKHCDAPTPAYVAQALQSSLIFAKFQIWTGKD